MPILSGTNTRRVRRALGALFKGAVGKDVLSRTWRKVQTDRRDLAAALRPIYTAVNAEAARDALEDFAVSTWGRKYPAVAPAWRRQWEQVIPFFAYPPEVRRIIVTGVAATYCGVRLDYDRRPPWRHCRPRSRTLMLRTSVR